LPASIALPPFVVRATVPALRGVAFAVPVAVAAATVNPVEAPARIPPGDSPETARVRPERG
jgi:hypothetical protein